MCNMINRSVKGMPFGPQHLLKGKVSLSNLPFQQITVILLLLPVQHPRGKPTGLTEQQDNERTEGEGERQRGRGIEERTKDIQRLKNACVVV